jgi:hypothetical protein
MISGDRAKPDNLPGTFDERVFIGGNYDLPVNLGKIRDMVRAAGWLPVFPLEFDIPRDQIHDWDLRILHSCRYAIFEVSQAAGELMEIERANEYRTKTLLVFQTRGPDQKEPPRVASMLRTCGQRLQGYVNDDDLRRLIDSFLFEEEYVDSYRKAFQFEVKQVQDEMQIHGNGRATRQCTIGGMTGTVGQVHHEFSTTHGFLSGFKFEHIQGEPKCTWNPDKDRSRFDSRGLQATHIEGRVTIGGQIESPITYKFTFENTPGSIALTDKEMRERYSAYTLPYEDISREVRYPMEELALKVDFPEEHDLIAQPAVLCGRVMQSEAIRPRKDSFSFDGKCAIFRVKWPCIFYEYAVYWHQPRENIVVG